MHARSRLLLFPVLLCTACNDSLTDSSGPTLRAATDSAAYTRTETGEAVARVTLHHDGGPAVALTGCPRPPSVYVERATSVRWEEAYSAGIGCFAIYSPSTVALSANSSLVFAVSAYQPGRYRVRVLIGPDPAAPEATVLSNEFVVR